MDLDAGRLDLEQIVERQRVAPLLEREHDLARAQRQQMAGEIGEVGAIDRARDRARPVVHRDEADGDEARTALPGQRFDARRTRAGAEHQNAALEAFAAQRRAEQRPRADHPEHREPGRVEQARAPEGHGREHEEEQREKEHAERHRDDEARGGEADRLQAPARHRRRPRPSRSASPRQRRACWANASRCRRRRRQPARA